MNNVVPHVNKMIEHGNAIMFINVNMSHLLLLFQLLTDLYLFRACFKRSNGYEKGFKSY